MDGVVGLWLILTKTLIVHFCAELQMVQGMTYIGCFRDRWNRDLSGYHGTGLRDNSPVACINSCLKKNTLYAAVQHGDECFCGNSYGKYGSIAESRCKVRCTGNRKLNCGGSWANSVYTTGKQLICDYTMPCWSNNGQEKYCPVLGAAEIINVTVIRHTCGTRRGNGKLDDIYEINGLILWVKHGCHVTFSVCYIPLGVTTSTTTFSLPISSSSATFVTTTSKGRFSSKANTITPDAAPNRSSTTVTITSNTTPIGSSFSSKQGYLSNTSTSPSYTKHSRLTEPDNTATVAIVVTITLMGLFLVTIVVIVVFRKRHARKARRIPLDEETFTTDQQASQYSNTIEMEALTTNKAGNSAKCITKDVNEESNYKADNDDKHYEVPYTDQSYHILETENRTHSVKNKPLHQTRYNQGNQGQNSKPKFQEVYYNASDIDDTLLYVNKFESESEYNTISKVPRKALVDPDYDRLNMLGRDDVFKEQDYYCHTTDTLGRLDHNVVDYSHVSFQNEIVKEDG